MRKSRRPSPNRRALALRIKAQPDEASCGPTCLEAVYRYHGDEATIESIVAEVRHLSDGGTLAVFLGSHALARGYRATIYTYNLRLFDPTWFEDEQTDVAAKLEQQLAAKTDSKFRIASEGYVDFLRSGGALRFEELAPSLLRRHFDRGLPVLAGVSATYLYRSPRERNNRYDDVRGEPSGHFIVLCGIDLQSKRVRVSDPYARNSFGRHRYSVTHERLSGAVHLGVLTYDANLLVIERPRSRSKRV